jgi:hypothetical protein
MKTNTSAPAPARELEAQWQLREDHWRRKLGRLRLGVEPIEEQLDRYRRVTWALTAGPSVLGVMFFTLFAVFGRPDIGLILVAVLLLPIVLVAWWDYAMMARRARRYLREVSHYRQETERLRDTCDAGRAANEDFR